MGSTAGRDNEEMQLYLSFININFNIGFGEAFQVLHNTISSSDKVFIHFGGLFNGDVAGNTYEILQEKGFKSN